MTDLNARLKTNGLTVVDGIVTMVGTPSLHHKDDAITITFHRMTYKYAGCNAVDRVVDALTKMNNATERYKPQNSRYVSPQRPPIETLTSIIHAAIQNDLEDHGLKWLYNDLCGLDVVVAGFPTIITGEMSMALCWPSNIQAYTHIFKFDGKCLYAPDWNPDQAIANMATMLRDVQNAMSDADSIQHLSHGTDWPTPF